MSTPKRMVRPEVVFSRADWDAATAEFPVINCGPIALCGMLGLRPLDVLPHIPNYRERCYTNPSMMAAALRALDVHWHERDDADCDGHTLTRYGLVRVQWEGPWTAPGANPRWGYRHTHWIGATDFGHPQAPVWVFDVNCGWKHFLAWQDEVVPKLVAMSPRAGGGWFATHRWELEVAA